MSIITPGAKENAAEVRKAISKKINKFLSDYYGRIIAVVTVVVLIFGFFFLIIPKYQQTVNFSEVINEQNVQDASEKQVELNKINSLIAAYQKIDRQYLTKIDEIAPVSKNKEELFSEFNYLVSRNQLYLQSISLSPIGAYDDTGLVEQTQVGQVISGNLESVKVDISVSGTDYVAFKNFLISLENNLRLMDIVNVRFSPSSQSAQMSIITYYSKALP